MCVCAIYRARSPLIWVRSRTAWTKRTIVATALGWIGTTGTFVAYLLLWRGRVGSESLVYALMNAMGGLLAGTASVLYGAWPSAVSNFVWAAIGTHSTIAALRRRFRAARPRSRSVGAVPDTMADCFV